MPNGVRVFFKLSNFEIRLESFRFSITFTPYYCFGPIFSSNFLPSIVTGAAISVNTILYAANNGYCGIPPVRVFLKSIYPIVETSVAASFA